MMPFHREELSKSTMVVFQHARIPTRQEDSVWDGYPAVEVPKSVDDPIKVEITHGRQYHLELALEVRLSFVNPGSFTAL